MTITDKVEKIKEEINKFAEDDFERDFYIGILNEFIDACSEYYNTIFDTRMIGCTKQQVYDLKEYQIKLESADRKRRNLHNTIIRDLVHIDGFAKKYNTTILYGKLTDEELDNYKLIENSSERRTKIAEDCVAMISRLL